MKKAYPEKHPFSYLNPYFLFKSGWKIISYVWACPEKVDTITFVIFAQTPLGKDNPAKNAAFGDCTKPRCTRRLPGVPENGWQIVQSRIRF
jgi:hypothetical protein